MADIPSQSLEKDAATPNRSKWLWGLLGLASVAALGVAVSRSVASKSSKTSRPPSDWQLINRIDAELSRAGVGGVEVYLRQRKVVLIASAERRDELRRAVEVVERIDGVQLIDALIRDAAPLSDSLTKP